MSGRVLMIGLLIVAACAGLGLWYTTERAYYYEVTDVTEVTAYGDAFPVSDYQGIDADTSPLKMRACFTVDWDYFPTDEFKDTATPLTAPRFFDCFDAKKIAEDLQAGEATAILSDENNPYGFDTYIAQYPDGAAFMWRQINKCGEAQFSGDDLPNGCPDPEGRSMEKKPGVASGGIGPVDVKVFLTPLDGSDPEPIDIRDPQGTIDNSDVSSFYACFTSDLSFGFVTETYEIIDEVNPPSPASSLPCFDAGQLRDDVQSGEAIAVMGEREVSIGVDRLVVIYNDGRGYAWNQRAE